jgi:molybdate transport system substrate-binding protein
MNATRACIALLICLRALPALAGGKITIAAADLKFALEEILVALRQANPTERVETSYGSSGKFHAQIRQGRLSTRISPPTSSTRVCSRRKAGPPPG